MKCFASVNAVLTHGMPSAFSLTVTDPLVFFQHSVSLYLPRPVAVDDGVVVAVDIQEEKIATWWLAKASLSLLSIQVFRSGFAQGFTWSASISLSASLSLLFSFVTSLFFINASSQLRNRASMGNTGTTSSITSCVSGRCMIRRKAPWRTGWKRLKVFLETAAPGPTQPPSSDNTARFSKPASPARCGTCCPTSSRPAVSWRRTLTASVRWRKGGVPFSRRTRWVGIVFWNSQQDGKFCSWDFLKNRSSMHHSSKRKSEIQKVRRKSLVICKFCVIVHRCNWLREKDNPQSWQEKMHFRLVRDCRSLSLFIDKYLSSNVSLWNQLRQNVKKMNNTAWWRNH